MRVVLMVIVSIGLTGCISQNGKLRPSALPPITFTHAEFANYTGRSPATTVGEGLSDKNASTGEQGDDRDQSPAPTGEHSVGEGRTDHTEALGATGRSARLYTMGELVSARARSVDGDDIRDRTNALIAGEIISRSDLICDQYLERVIIARNEVVSAIEIGALASSSAAGLAGIGRTANVFGGLSTFLTGSRTSLEETVFAGTDIRELRRAAVAARLTAGTALRARVRAAENGTEALEVVVAEIGDYHRQCGIEYGLDARTSMVDRADNEARAERAAQQTGDATPRPPGASPTEGARSADDIEGAAGDDTGPKTAQPIGATPS